MKKLLSILLLGTILVVLIISALAWLSYKPPSWYTPPNYSNPEVAKLADRAEYRLNEEFHKIRDPEHKWSIRVTDQAMNAWLSGRLEGWLTHDQDMELPPNFKDPQVYTTPEGIWLGAMVSAEPTGGDKEALFRPVAIQLLVWVDSGGLYVEPKALRLGVIPIPLSVLEAIMEEIDNKTQVIDAIAPLMDDREVHIREITLETGAIVLTCQTVLPQ